jgi:hypothetical protein
MLTHTALHADGYSCLKLIHGAAEDTPRLDGDLVEWRCDNRNKAAGARRRWEELPRCFLAGVVARRSLCGDVLDQRRADCPVLVRRYCQASSERLGHLWTSQRSIDLLALPRLSASGSPDILQASRKPYRLDLPCRRHNPDRLREGARPGKEGWRDGLPLGPGPRSC